MSDFFLKEVGPGAYARVSDSLAHEHLGEMAGVPNYVEDEPTTEKSNAKLDLKAGVGGVKPQLSQLPMAGLVYAARAFQYGASKYARGNYRRPTVDKVADLDRLSAYIDATFRHLFAVTTEIEWMRGNTELEGSQLLIGAYPDAESKLPHLAHAVTSLLMAIQQGVDAGILPEDPGTPWEAR